jgi:hypothetical protein
MSICDCELSHNGLGLSGRECDCPTGETKMTETDDEFLTRARAKIHNAFSVSEASRLLALARRGMTAREDALEYLRGLGWMVAVHNDYRLNGVFHTFWLFTHPDGRYVKGEGTSDCEALSDAIAAAIEAWPGKSSAKGMSREGEK